MVVHDILYPRNFERNMVDMPKISTDMSRQFIRYKT